MGYLAFKWRTGKAKNPFTYDSPHWRRWWQGWFDRIRELIEHE